MRTGQLQWQYCFRKHWMELSLVSFLRTPMVFQFKTAIQPKKLRLPWSQIRGFLSSATTVPFLTAPALSVGIPGPGPVLLVIVKYRFAIPRGS